MAAAGEPEEQKLLKQFEETNFMAGEVTPDMIIGVSDHLFVPFALAAGLSLGNAPSLMVVLTGIGISVGLGRYLAAKSAADSYAKELTTEQEVIIAVPYTEAGEEAGILAAAQKGIEAREDGPVVSALRKRHQPWLDYMMKIKLGLEKADPKRVLKNALTIAIAYILGGLVPLVSYMFIPRAQDAVLASVVLTIAALLVFGYVVGHFTGNKPFRSAFQTALIGVLEAAAAFGLAKTVQR